MKTIQLPKSLLALAAGALALTLGVPAARVFAQTQTETKIRLMADALRARDAGDLATAKKNLEELLVVAPNDVTVQRLLASVNAALDSGEAAPVTAPNPVEEPVTDIKFTEIKNETYKAASPQPSAESTVDAEAEALAKAEENRLKDLIDAAKAEKKNARVLAKSDRYDEAIAVIDGAVQTLPANPLTQATITDLQKERGAIILEKVQFLLRTGDTDAARTTLDTYAQTGRDTRKVDAVAAKITRAEFDPPLPPIEQASPRFIAEQKETAKLAAKGRAQYLAGDSDGAQETFRQVEAIDPDSPEAKNFLRRIADEKAQVGALNREKTRAQMIEEVAKAWQRPGIYQERAVSVAGVAGDATPLAQKLNSILIPSVNFNNVDLTRAVAVLSASSEEFDPSSSGPKGVNIVLLDPSNKNPQVSITLRNMSLKRVLDFITDAVGYQYEVQADAIVVRPGGETSTLDTEFFPVTRSTVIRMTGLSGGSAASTSTAALDPFAAPAATPAAGGGGEASALRAFLQQAGVNFDGTEGSSLAYDGSAMIVTQTTRNVERIRNILNRYNDVRQVEIEAKFMEVQEGALDELGVQWNIGRRGVAQFDPSTGLPVLDSSGRQVFKPRETYTTGGGVNRTLGQAFSSSSGSGSLVVTRGATTDDEGNIIDQGGTQMFNAAAPSLPGAAQLASAVGNFASISGIVGEFDVNAVVRALSQKSGTDLLSAPKVTVLSGNPANIVVAQELRYPQSYGEIQAQVGTGNQAGGGSAGVAITAGTPQEFTSRNVGVELKVTPTVEEDDYSVSLDLNPVVTEFEGFVEYGGTSIAISGGTSVTVPSGFYQPIFSRREVSTKVTIWDGATLVMGGLTREEVKKVNDKVPILGDIPVLGRAFRSKGESSQKRNLLIFVTANLVSPGGSPKKQQLKSTQPSSLFQNPTIVTPASSESRVRGSK